MIKLTIGAFIALFALSAFAQIDPVDKDPTLGAYIVNGPAGIAKFHNVSLTGPASRTSSSPSLGVKTTALPGDYEIQISDLLFSSNFPVTIQVKKLTTVELPAVSLCGEYYSYYGATLNGALWSPPTILAYKNPTGYEQHLDLAQLLFEPANPVSGACEALPYIAMPGHYSLQLRFDPNDLLYKYLPDFKPLEFDAKVGQLTKVMSTGEDLTARIVTHTYGQSIYPIVNSTLTAADPRCSNSAVMIYPKKFISLASNMADYDFARNRPVQGSLKQSEAMTAQIDAPTNTFPVWPLKPGAPATYYAWVSGITQEFSDLKIGETRELEVKTLNVNDVRITPTDPNTPDYFVSGQIKIYLLNGAGQHQQQVHYQQYVHYTDYTNCWDPHAFNSLSTTSTLSFPTKSSFELLAGKYEVLITYYHPEEKATKLQTWALDCSAPKVEDCSAQLISEGPVP